jgi:hypothetical protein
VEGGSDLKNSPIGFQSIMSRSEGRLEARKLEYRHNAALVLKSERYGPKEPSGEAVSLSGRFLKMGDRARASDQPAPPGSSSLASSAAPSVIAQRIEKARKKRDLH